MVTHASESDDIVSDVESRERRFHEVSQALLGGSRLVGHQVSNRTDIHLAIVRGIPYASLLHLITKFKGLTEGEVVSVLGISTRTLRRQRVTPKKSMPADLASKTWLFAETLAKASEVFGGQEEAAHWMSKPAMGLDGQRPIELLQTVQGAELVNEFLGRLEYGVYT